MARLLTAIVFLLLLAVGPSWSQTEEIHFGKYHALVIGNNEYTHIDKLKTAVTDAEAIAKTLTDEYGYSVTLLINATRSSILKTLSQYRKRSNATTTC